MEKSVKVLWMFVMCMAVAACSGNKKPGGSNIASAEVAGYYLGVDEFEKWSCNLNDDGTGYEMAAYSTGSVQITMPFTWSLENGEVTFTFLPDEVLVECDEESDAAPIILSSALAGYSEPRVCTVSKKAGNVVIDGEGLYPTFEQVNVE